MVDDRVFKLLVKSNINGSYNMEVREIEFFSVKDLEEKYEVKTTRGMHCDHLTYTIGFSNYKKSYWDEIVNLGSAICIIEESEKGFKIVTLDKKYQIDEELVKNIRQVRFDNFDYGEGYINFVGVNELDANDQAGLEANAMHEFIGGIIEIYNNNPIITLCEFDILQFVLKKYNEWCLAGNSHYPIISLRTFNQFPCDFRIARSCLLAVNSIGNELSSLNNYYIDAIKYIKQLGIRENMDETAINLYLNHALKGCNFLTKEQKEGINL